LGHIADPLHQPGRIHRIVAIFQPEHGCGPAVLLHQSAVTNKIENVAALFQFIKNVLERGRGGSVRRRCQSTDRETSASQTGFRPQFFVRDIERRQPRLGILRVDRLIQIRRVRDGDERLELRFWTDRTQIGA